MVYVLNKKIIKAIIREEEDTSRRYHHLGKMYGIPALIRAGDQEANHAELFKRIYRRFSKLKAKK